MRVGEVHAVYWLQHLGAKGVATMSMEHTYAQIVAFARARGASRVVMFGSRARGCAAPKSDIDIAVEGCKDMRGFREDVDERLWSLLRVDVIDLDSYVSPALRADIARDGRVLYEKV